MEKSLMLELSERIASDSFAQSAPYPDFPQAITRSRKVALPTLIASLLSMRNQSQQDGFFAWLCGSEFLLRDVSDPAFAKARDRLYWPALVSLNVGRSARRRGWPGPALVRAAGELAADASLLMPAVQPCLLSRSAAQPDQRLFVLFRLGAELTLHASVHSAQVAERGTLVEALDLLGPDDVPVLDQGCPAAWLVALLNARGIRFVMRCDNHDGWSATKAFFPSGAAEASVRLNPPAPTTCAIGAAREARRSCAWCDRLHPMAVCACSPSPWTPDVSTLRCSAIFTTSAGASEKPSSACTSKPSRA